MLTMQPRQKQILNSILLYLVVFSSSISFHFFFLSFLEIISLESAFLFLLLHRLLSFSPVTAVGMKKEMVSLWNFIGLPACFFFHARKTTTITVFQFQCKKCEFTFFSPFLFTLNLSFSLCEINPFS